MREQIGRFFLVVLVLLAAVYGVLSLRSQPVPAQPFFAASDGPLVIAHQGGEELRPSNTMVAFQHAADLGVDVLELDVHATQDGVLVVMHDDTVDRTTDGSGAIREMSWADLNTLDAGHYWTNDEGQTFPYRGQGIRVPALTEVVDGFPDRRLNVEIKQEQPSIVVPFCQLLRDHRATERVLVASFHESTMLEMRAHCPEVATSLVRAEIEPFWILSVLGLGAVYQSPGSAIQVPERSSLPLLGEVQVVTRGFVRQANRHNVPVHVWTVDETADMERLLAMGVNGIITDRPDRLLGVLGR